ncbi:GDP-D-glucose phosphorylase 1 [Alosa sapidissima]|uniref:GDP-D-glucose phosphorylase 1 n=1 Tax=Alosa sapidissima TaxID=34773 RepID=UPI001C0942E2|nr:GDP-D-glucose phosphorylase 1 [Alosa sapidissima]
MPRLSRLSYCVRLAMESPCSAFVYSNADYSNHVSRFRGNDKPPDLSKFDMYLRSAWVERMQRGLFRYHLGHLETRILPGHARLVAQLNVERGQQRRKPQEILSIKQDFDPKLFNFNKANTNETMFELRKHEVPEAIHEDGFIKGCRMIINVSPLEFGHSLIVPEPNQCYPQVLTHHSIQVGIESVLLSTDPGFRVGFNSMGAFASVNHLHLHAYYLNHELAIESAPAESVMNARGLHCLSTFPRGFLLYTEGGDLHSVVSTIHTLTDFLVNHNVAHNLFLTRGSPPDAEGAHDTRRSGVRIIVWPRLSCFGAKEETAFNVALCELAGHLSFKNREDYETTTEEKVHSIIKKYILSPEMFLDLQAQIISHLTLLESDTKHCE